MTKFKEILRLQQQGLSQRQIAVSLRISRNTIKEFFRRLESSDLSLPLNEHLSDQDIWNTLYGTKSEGPEYQRPDYDWVTKEMRHKGVTLLSLWGSYRLRCKEMDVHAYGYVDSIAIFGISSIPIFRIGKDMGFPPFERRYFLNVIEFSGLVITG